ncbi:unnamed protein product [Pleuronectes platessa]|uniref:Uncharacterized protein n=1 Tax=Pleuronectes platessa TaxID=8262 RepID=A0A9N7YWU2_PLEPL|nr:unnamed protein product [Pleuronectes platessa]
MLRSWLYGPRSSSDGGLRQRHFQSVALCHNQELLETQYELFLVNHGDILQSQGPGGKLHLRVVDCVPASRYTRISVVKSADTETLLHSYTDTYGKRIQTAQKGDGNGVLEDWTIPSVSAQLLLALPHLLLSAPQPYRRRSAVEHDGKKKKRRKTWFLFHRDAAGQVTLWTLLHGHDAVLIYGAADRKSRSGLALDLIVNLATLHHPRLRCAANQQDWDRCTMPPLISCTFRRRGSMLECSPTDR